MCGEMPDAPVIGLDLVANKPGALANYRAVRGNVLAGAGPVTERLAELLRRLSRTRGLDSTGIVFRALDAFSDVVSSCRSVDGTAWSDR